MSCAKLLRSLQSQHSLCSKERMQLKLLHVCGRERKTVKTRFLPSAENFLPEHRACMVWTLDLGFSHLSQSKACIGLSFSRLCQLRKLHLSAVLGMEDKFYRDETSEDQGDSGTGNKKPPQNPVRNPP